MEMREMKTTSMNGRKHLNELTKTFRSKAREEQLGMVTEVLKSYQEEIDALSRRAKYSESAFYALYKAIFEAPDPCTALDGLVSMIASSSTNQLEIERLRAELLQYDEEFQQLKNQDITIRRLEDQLSEFRDKIEDKVKEEVDRRVQEIEEATALKISESRELQRAAEKRLQAAVENMRQAQASADRAQTQLFEVSSQAEVRTSALLAENVILAEANERSASRLAEAEAALELLRSAQDSAPSSSSSTTAGASLSTALSSGSLASERLSREDELNTLHAQLAELRSEHRRKEEAWRSERQRLDSAARETSSLLTREREALSKLRQELGERPRKEELTNVRRQLRMLQRVAFNVEEEDDGDADPETTSETAQLEAMLIARMKSLETELADARVKIDAGKKAAAAATVLAADLQKQLSASTALVARLEGDLEASQSHGHAATSKKQLDHAGTRLHSAGAGLGGGAGAGSDFASMELSELLGVSSPAVDSLGKAGAGGQAGQMISVLQAQRDRYKSRLSASEATALSLQQQVATLTAAKQQAESDNLALYSKIRFLQQQGREGQAGAVSPMAMRIRAPAHGASRDGSSSSASSSSASSSAAAADLEGHYSDMYEQRLNPFAEFNQRERQRRLDQVCRALSLLYLSLLASILSTDVFAPSLSAPPPAVCGRPGRVQRLVHVHLAQSRAPLPRLLPWGHARAGHGRHLVAHASRTPRVRPVHPFRPQRSSRRCRCRRCCCESEMSRSGGP